MKLCTVRGKQPSNKMLEWHWIREWMLKIRPLWKVEVLHIFIQIVTVYLLSHGHKVTWLVKQLSAMSKTIYFCIYITIFYLPYIVSSITYVKKRVTVDIEKLISMLWSLFRNIEILQGVLKNWFLKFLREAISIVFPIDNWPFVMYKRK